MQSIAVTVQQYGEQWGLITC